MNKLEKYLIANLSTLFLSIFLSLFAIASVIFLIKLATYTAVIQLSILEMIKLYLFFLPQILFYTLPITFFIAAALAIFRLSNDNEIVVLFALGIKPSFLVKTLAKPAFLLSFLLFLNFLVLFPHTTVLSDNFISYKKSEAQFNLSASEFGHKFGDWLLYLGSKNKDGSYGDVFLFNKNKKEEVLIGAKKAQVLNDGGILRLKLTNGQGYSYSSESLSQINFLTMYINDTLQTKLKTYKNPFEYWTNNDRRKFKNNMLITNTLLSLFPLISIFLIISISVVHARHQKSMIYLWLFASIILFYGLSMGLQKAIGFYTIALVAPLWLIATYTLYRKTIVSRF